MTFSIPNKTTVIITARRRAGVIQPPGPLIGPINEITYDFVAMGGEQVVLERTNVLPSKRVASPIGEIVDIEAADIGDEATFEVLPTAERLFVRESIVFDSCEGG